MFWKFAYVGHVRFTNNGPKGYWWRQVKSTLNYIGMFLILCYAYQPLHLYVQSVLWHSSFIHRRPLPLHDAEVFLAARVPPFMVFPKAQCWANSLCRLRVWIWPPLLHAPCWVNYTRMMSRPARVVWQLTLWLPFDQWPWSQVHVCQRPGCRQIDYGSG